MKKNFFYNFLLTGSNLLLPLLTFPYLSRVLGANGLGICNFITSYGQNYIIIAALGLPIYGIREIAKVGNDQHKRSKIFFELLSLHLIVTTILLITYIISIFYYDELLEYKNIALLGGFLIFFNVFSVDWLFNGINNFKYITIRSLLIRFSSVLAIFLLVRKKDDYYIYFLINTITVFLTVLMDIYYARKFVNKPSVLSLAGVFSHAKPISVLGIYMVLTSIYSVLPLTLLGFFSTKASVGYFAGANKIVRLTISFFSSLTLVMIPKINQLSDNENREEYIELIDKSLNFAVTFGLPISIGMMFLAEPLILILSGDNFQNSVPVIRIMSPIVFIVALAQVFVQLILSVHRKDNYMVKISILGMICGTLINVVFIPYFSEKATGYSQLTSELLVTVFSYYLSRRILNFVFPIKFLMINLVCSVPMILIILALRLLHLDALSMLISSIIICSLYFMFYQLFLVKNTIFKNIFEVYLVKFKKRYKIEIL